MDPASAIGSFFAALGLAGAAGLNAWVPLLAVAMGGRLEWFEVSESYDFLQSTPAIVSIGVCLAADFVADKVPAVDHVLHAVGGVVSPAAGALLFAAQTGVAGDLDPGFAYVVGAVVSGGVHAERAALRPLSTVGTGGLGNPVLSLAEDALSVTLTVVAFLLPVLALLFVLSLAIAGALAWRALRRRRQ